LSGVYFQQIYIMTVMIRIINIEHQTSIIAIFNEYDIIIVIQPVNDDDENVQEDFIPQGRCLVEKSRPDLPMVMQNYYYYCFCHLCCRRGYHLFEQTYC